MKPILRVCAAVGVLSAATLTIAHDDDDPIERLIEYRQSAFHMMEFHVGPIAAMLKNEMPYDEEAVRQHTAAIAAVAPMIHYGFAEPSTSPESEAKAIIWENKEDFDNKMARLVETTEALASVAAESADMESVKPAFLEAGKACKSCHDEYLEEH